MPPWWPFLVLLSWYSIIKSSHCNPSHYDDVTMDAIASQITSLTIVYSTVYSGADQSRHQSSASLAFVWGIHRGPVNSPHKWPVTRKMFPFDDVIMQRKGTHEFIYEFLIVIWVAMYRNSTSRNGHRMTCPFLWTIVPTRGVCCNI